MLGVAGVTAMETTVAAVTVKVVVPVMPLMVAVIVTEPGAAAVASPPVAAIEAMLGLDEVQATIEVRS
jgi:hypothetical protein